MLGALPSYSWSTQRGIADGPKAAVPGSKGVFQCGSLAERQSRSALASTPKSRATRVTSALGCMAGLIASRLKYSERLLLVLVIGLSGHLISLNALGYWRGRRMPRRTRSRLGQDLPRAGAEELLKLNQIRSIYRLGWILVGVPE